MKTDAKRMTWLAGSVVVIVVALSMVTTIAAGTAGAECRRDRTGTATGPNMNEASQEPYSKALAKPRHPATERVGFEPTVPIGHTAFPVPPDRPLRHLSRVQQELL